MDKITKTRVYDIDDPQDRSDIKDLIGSVVTYDLAGESGIMESPFIVGGKKYNQISAESPDLEKIEDSDLEINPSFRTMVSRQIRLYDRAGQYLISAGLLKALMIFEDWRDQVT